MASIEKSQGLSKILSDIEQLKSSINEMKEKNETLMELAKDELERQEKELNQLNFELDNEAQLLRYYRERKVLSEQTKNLTVENNVDCSILPQEPVKAFIKSSKKEDPTKLKEYAKKDGNTLTPRQFVLKMLEAGERRGLLRGKHSFSGD